MLTKNFSGRERYLAFTTLSIMMFAAIYAFIISPISARWGTLNSQIRSKVGTLDKDAKLLANQKALMSEYSQLSKKARSGGSEEQAVADTLAYIENVSNNDSCFIVNIKPLGITDNGSYKEILIDVTAEAGVAQFSKFLYDIENPRDVLINVKRFTLSSKPGQSGTLKGTFFISKILLD